MVRRVLSRLLCAALLLWLPLSAQAVDQADFSVRLLEGPQEYGTAVQMRLTANHLRSRLDAIDLSAWQQDFVVVPLENQDYDTAKQHQGWTLQLYPRHPGRLTLPPLVFHGAQSESLTLDVAPAHEGREQRPIEVSSHVSATQAWLQQPVEVVMEIVTPTPYVSFGVEAARRDGFEVTPLEHTREALVDNKTSGRTRHKLGWRLLPLQSGKHELQLPAVEYRRGGIVTHRFYPPPLQLDIRPLPSYLPATVPVDRVELETVLPDRLFIEKGELNFLTLKLSGAAQARSASAALRQLRTAPDVNFYPVTERAETGQGGTSYRLPFAANALGLVSLPPVRLQYFDPDSGKIVTRIHQPGRLLVLNRWLLGPIVVVGLVFAIVVLRFAWQWLKAYLQRLLAYRTALAAIRQAEDAASLRKVLADIARAEGWPGNLSLEGWSRCWSRCHPGNADLSESVKVMGGHLYGRDDGSLDDVRAGLVVACLQRMPVLRLIAL